uniref:G_PROTEIN_RECEP_F1_2 domain-containing protein n=1 Tax=Steinernema glaseri TaxID=37863 RepID=A0A1I7YNZ8_9BILA
MTSYECKERTKLYMENYLLYANRICTSYTLLCVKEDKDHINYVSRDPNRVYQNTTLIIVKAAMPRTYQILYDRILDATAIIDIPVKLFALYIVVRNTPKDMRHLSLFLMTYMFWNFAANIIFAFVHVYPLFPAECFRFDGIVGALADNDVFSYSVLYILILCSMNAGVVIAFTFPYRYIAFAHPTLKIKPIYVFGLYTAANICVASCLGYLYLLWAVSYDDYPKKEDLLERTALICLKPSGWEKDIIFICLFTFVLCLVVIGVTSSVLLLRSIHSKKGQMHEKLLKKHKQILWTLIVITIIPVVFGGIPFTLLTIYMYEPRLLYAAEMCMIMIVLIANHGTLNAVAVVVAIKPYRQAA